MSKIPNKFDVRVIERNLKKGIITQEELDQYLQSLPDVSEAAVPMFQEKSQKSADSSETDSSTDASKE